MKHSANDNVMSIASLSFRPQREILDPSHSFGMTALSEGIATQSLAGEKQGAWHGEQNLKHSNAKSALRR